MNDLKKHQHVMLQMLSEIDRICKKNDIPYMLFAGSLLGAVRHKGFIPWDDDLDVIMMRKDYKRFLEIAGEELDKDEYYLQAEFTEHWPMFFSKLRKNGTACIERYIPKDMETHLGVYIDIFPMDNLYDQKFMQYLQFFASKIVIAKSLDARGYLTKNLLKKVFMLICRMIPQKGLIAFVLNEKGTNTNKVHSFFGGARKFEKNVFERDWIRNKIQLPFENMMFSVPGNYSKILTTIYGDYMVPTPEHKRGIKVHGEIVDLENSYVNYIGVQRSMILHEYTRSIR